MLYRAAAKSAGMGNSLPMLLFGACVMLVSTGPIQSNSTVGFSVLGGGLCLAACNSVRALGTEATGAQSKAVTNSRKQRGRSRYAAMLREEDDPKSVRNRRGTKSDDAFAMSTNSSIEVANVFWMRMWISSSSLGQWPKKSELGHWGNCP
jgi:hypothetical protein